MSDSFDPSDIQIPIEELAPFERNVTFTIPFEAIEVVVCGERVPLAEVWKRSGEPDEPLPTCDGDCSRVTDMEVDPLGPFYVRQELRCAGEARGARHCVRVSHPSGDVTVVSGVTKRGALSIASMLNTAAQAFFEGGIHADKA